jgi:NAD(P)-dependent dehydrogenase (short-subunit alcohol dehydrogenase family)
VTERFDGKTVLVTGAARGIGRATARPFAEHSAAVGLVGRAAEGLARVEGEISAAGGSAFALVCDVWDGAAVVPYLTLLPEAAGQREHPLREVFDGLRDVVRHGIPWRAMPSELPPHALHDHRVLNAVMTDRQTKRTS